MIEAKLGYIQYSYEQIHKKLNSRGLTFEETQHLMDQIDDLSYLRQFPMDLVEVERYFKKVHGVSVPIKASY